MSRIAKKHVLYQITCALLPVFCLILSGCARKQTGQELLESTISEETDACRIVELLLEKRSELMQTIGNFTSEEELLSALKEVYTEEEADALYEEWLCEETYGLYEKSDDGTLVLKADAQLPVVSDGYDVSILSYSEEASEAFVIHQPTDLSSGSRGDSLETVEILSIIKNEQGFRLASCRSDVIRRDYFSEEGEEPAKSDDASDLLSEEEAYEIVKELFEKWTDYYYRFYAMSYPGELFTIDGHGDYQIYPSDSFSSMEDLCAQLEEIMTQGCARHFQSIWQEQEIPYYCEQDGVLYRIDAIVPEMGRDSVYAVIVEECGSESIHAFVIGNNGGENNQSRMVYEFFLVKTAQGWRADQIHRGCIDMEEVQWSCRNEF